MESRAQNENAGEQQFGAAHGAGGSASFGGATATADGEKEVLRSYPYGDRQRAEIEMQFTYHPPQPDQIPRYEAIRQKARELAELYMTSTPPSREQSLAITDLRRSAFWANASIALNENVAK